MKKILFLLFLIPTLIAGQKCIKGDCKNGQGVMIWSSGAKYVGEFKYGKAWGQGTFKFGKGKFEGNIYDGQVKDNYFDGQGTYTWSSGDKFIGKWQGGKRTEGTYYRVSGVTYFSNGFQNSQLSWLIYWPHGFKYNYLPESEAFNLDFNKIIVDYVNFKVNKWQKKGEFEKLAIYNARVNEITRNQMVDKYQTEAIDELKYEFERSVKIENILLKTYDSENETFLMSSDYIGDFILNVPIQKAEAFKQNSDSIKVSESNYVFSSNKFILSQMKFIDLDGSEYIYNNKNQSSHLLTNIDYNFSDIEIDLPKTQVSANTVTKTNNISVGKADVDINIPVNNKRNPHRYALIIGNEDYSSFQTGLSSEVNVDYAINDAKVFSEYCEKTLGVDSRHLKLLTNATYGHMSQAIAWVQNLSKIEGGNAEIIFYYSGHGLPDEETKEGYLMPVDISGNNVSRGIKLKDLYAQLNKYPAKEITVVLDACFSGGARNEGLIAMKGVKINPKEDVVSGNMVVFASSSGSESSAVYREKQHGYLTYFLLKKIQETKGYVNYKDLSDFLDYQVRKETAIIGKVQTPKVNVSLSARDQWKYWSFR